MFNSRKCKRCESKIRDSFDFCPTCGSDLRDPTKDMENFGMLGKGNFVQGYPLVGGEGGLGITDKMINSLFRNLMKNVEKQMKDINFEQEPEVQTMPNGIRIKIGGNVQKQPKRQKKTEKIITEQQIERMSKLPRAEAKTNVRRFSDKVIYELNASGVLDVNDVFVSKLENGYEVKAIGSKKVYVNSIPVNLPLKAYRITDEGVNLEFGLG